jgi:hypothetical protein
MRCVHRHPCIHQVLCMDVRDLAASLQRPPQAIRLIRIPSLPPSLPPSLSPHALSDLVSVCLCKSFSLSHSPLSPAYSNSLQVATGPNLPPCWNNGKYKPPPASGAWPAAFGLEAVQVSRSQGHGLSPVDPRGPGRLEDLPTKRRRCNDPASRIPRKFPSLRLQSVETRTISWNRATRRQKTSQWGFQRNHDSTKVDEIL